MRLNLNTLKLSSEDSETVEEPLLKNGVIIKELSKHDDLQLEGLFYSYGDFFVVKNGIYRGVNCECSEVGDIIILGFNGMALTQEEFDSRKR